MDALLLRGPPSPRDAGDDPRIEQLHGGHSELKNTVECALLEAVALAPLAALDPALLAALLLGEARR